MALQISSLNSGSNGNCYYVGNDNEAVLIDAGLSCREVEKRMKRSGLKVELVKAIFVSHEHTDHVKGLYSLVKKYAVPVYCTSLTAKACRLHSNYATVHYINALEAVVVGELTVTAFGKNHDAADPVSFTVSCKNITAGIFTDIGVVCHNVIAHFSLCNAVFLEANYDEEMLEKGNYPYYLKRRIKGGNGHLSNNQALELFIKHRPPFLKYLLLSHLSKNNNRPDLAAKLFAAHANGVNITVASRDCETPVYRLSNELPKRIFMKKQKGEQQLAFAF